MLLTLSVKATSDYSQVAKDIAAAIVTGVVSGLASFDSAGSSVVGAPVNVWSRPFDLAAGPVIKRGGAVPLYFCLTGGVLPTTASSHLAMQALDGVSEAAKTAQFSGLRALVIYAGQGGPMPPDWMGPMSPDWLGPGVIYAGQGEPIPALTLRVAVNDKAIAIVCLTNTGYAGVLGEAVGVSPIFDGTEQKYSRAVVMSSVSNTAAGVCRAANTPCFARLKNPTAPGDMATGAAAVTTVRAMALYRGLGESIYCQMTPVDVWAVGNAVFLGVIDGVYQVPSSLVGGDYVVTEGGNYLVMKFYSMCYAVLP